MLLPNPLAADLDHILEHTRQIWEPTRGQSLFLTGGTGFFGRWMLESLAWANRELDLNLKATVLTRDPGTFAQKAPHLAKDPAIELYSGDLTTFAFPVAEFHAVLHLATQPEFSPNAEAPLGIFDANVKGTQHLLEFARRSNARRFLFTSSGAAYGRQPAALIHITEDYSGAPDTMDPASAYGQSKRASEFLCMMYARQYGFAATIARCFAFSGPHLPLNSNYAIGNFVRDGLQGGPIRIGGDGTPHRSYLYAADLAIWLWTILFKGESCRLYNVGSADGVPIMDLALRIKRIVAPNSEVLVARAATAGAPPSRYVPSVTRAENELGLKVLISLDEGIQRMADWNRANA